MKRIIAVSLLAVLCLMILGACVKKDTSDAAAASGSASAQATLRESADTAAVTESGAAEATPGSLIIAESSNTISDAEKQEILDGLMGEIDSVLGSIDSLEDLEDSDLGTDDIG